MINTETQDFNAAVKGLMLEVPRGHQCKECDAVYVHEKTMIKHLVKEHTGVIEHRVEILKKERDEGMKAWAKERMLNWFPRIEEKFLEAKAEFLQKMLDGELTYTISWRTEDMIKEEKKMVHAKVFGNIVSCFEDTEDWAGCLEEVTKRRDEMKEDVLNRMPRHNSTSLMSNAVEQWEAEAIAELVSARFGGGAVGELVHYLKDLNK